MPCVWQCSCDSQFSSLCFPLSKLHRPSLHRSMPHAISFPSHKAPSRNSTSGPQGTSPCCVPTTVTIRGTRSRSASNRCVGARLSPHAARRPSRRCAQRGREPTHHARDSARHRGGEDLPRAASFRHLCSPRWPRRHARRHDPRGNAASESRNRNSQHRFHASGAVTI